MASQDFWEALMRENLTEAEYLDRVLGPKYLPMKIVLPMTCVYVIIFITGVFGNVITCMVIIKNSSMQNATNYYLFSLAISDLMLLILGLPNELSVFWQQYPWALGIGLCKTRAYVSEMSSYVSVMTIAAFSTERYFAICHPLNMNAMSGSKRLVRIILALWLIAGVSALPFAIYTNVVYVDYPLGSGKYSLDSAICATLFPEFPLYELSCVIFFLIPMLIILVMYTRMGLKIRKSIKSSSRETGDFNSSIHRESKKVQSRKSIIRMLSTVVVMFFICWAPFHAQRLLYVYGQAFDYYPDLSEWLYLLSGCLYYVSTTVNPILYNIMSTRYRVAFKKTICCKKLNYTRKKQNSTFYNMNVADKSAVSIQRPLRYNEDRMKTLLSSTNQSYDKDSNENQLKIPYEKDFVDHRVVVQQISIKSTTSNTTFVTESQLTNLL